MTEYSLKSNTDTMKFHLTTMGCRKIKHRTEQHMEVHTQRKDVTEKMQIYSTSVDTALKKIMRLKLCKLS